MTKHTILLRRDFADELGFGEFLRLKQTTPACAGRAEFNRDLFLSPDLPRFLVYYSFGGKGCITADGAETYHAPFAGLFADMAQRVERAASEDPFWTDAAAACGRALSLEADEDGRPVLVLLHDTHTNACYLMDAKPAFDVIAGQP